MHTDNLNGIVGEAGGFSPEEYIKSRRANGVSAIAAGLESLLKQGATINEKKLHFIHQLALVLPKEADPYMETLDGTEVDIYWEDLLIISLTDQDAVSVSCFSTGKQQFEFFEDFTDDSLRTISRFYNTMSTKL